MNLNQVGQTYKLSQWITLVRDCQSSGKTVEAWCNDNNISRNTYYYWLRRVRRAACENLPGIVKRENPIVPVTFQIPVVSSEKIQSCSDAGITLHIGSFILELHNGMSSELLTTTLQALNHVG